jgi:energy-coupling factor transporter ATP-binding protein EcfA2
MNDHYQPPTRHALNAVATGRSADAIEFDESALPQGSRDLDEVSDPHSSTERSVGILTLARQILWNDLTEMPAEYAIGAGVSPDDNAPPWTTSFRIYGSAADLMRAIATSQEDYLVFSPRPGLIWDRNLVLRIERELAAFESLSIPWFCLSADGLAFDGTQYAAAFFNNEPTLVPDRGRRLIVQTAGTIYVFKVPVFRELGARRVAGTDLVLFINNMIVIAYGRGFGSFFTSGLYPCISEHRSLPYVGIEEQLISLDLGVLLNPADSHELFPREVSRRYLLGAWVETLSSVLAVKHRFSFVIRTLFRRQHLLRRCLISIDYIRRSLGIFVEIVLASDTDEPEGNSSVHELSLEFPHMTFVVADGRKGNGYSRVRNLIAGLQKSTGTRVCIIDDDDYYTPEAVVSFAKSCEFGAEQLVIFDTQIIVEKWTSAGVKFHKEIVQYGELFRAKLWTVTLRGSNSIPLCGIIHPGWFIRQVAQEYVYDFDLSEDFVFHLICLTHPNRPTVKVVEGVGAHQSHRVGDDNVSVVQDRTKWVLDTGNGLYQFLFMERRSLDVVSGGEVNAGEVSAHDRVKSLEIELARSNQAHSRATEALAGLIARTTGRMS